MSAVLSAVLGFTIPVGAQARGGGAAHIGGFAPGKAMGAKPGAVHHEAAKPLGPTSPFGPQRPGAPRTQTEALERNSRGFHRGNGYGYGSDGIGYGVPGVYPETAAYDPGFAPGGYPPPYGYSYEAKPPQLTCIRPRLIVLGAKPAHAPHLPKVVYGSPLPCGAKG